MHEAPKRVESRFDKIGPTALVVAYRRSFSDIPFAKEIYNLVSQKSYRTPRDVLRKDLAPQIEARYKIVDRYLNASGIKQVLEIASGLSPRGLAMTEDPSISYVELDLPQMVGTKTRVLADLMGREVVPFRSNLAFQSGNALEPVDLVGSVANFNPNQPLAIINEGLMRYLTLEERAVLGRNIYDVLARFGGVWITPDISLKRVMQNENERDASHVSKISEMTGADIAGNRFEDVESAKAFFEDLGFNVEIRGWLEVSDQLTSPAQVGVSAEEVEKMNSLPVLFVMTPKNT